MREPEVVTAVIAMGSEHYCKAAGGSSFALRRWWKDPSNLEQKEHVVAGGISQLNALLSPPP